MAEQLELNVKGMDCPSCTAKIEGAVCALPGVEKVSLNYTSQKLRLELGAEGNAQDVRATIRKLGYKVSSAAPEAPGRWWQTPKGQMVLLAGGLLALASVLSVLVPGLAGYVFAAAALLALAPLAKKAYSAARLGQPFTIETLVTIAVLGAIAIGEAAEAATVVFLFQIGELLESVAAARARASVSALAGLVPKTAMLVRGDGVVEVEAASLTPGDEVELRPGGRVPADGVVRTGETEMDESAITGESVPRPKRAGDAVFAGAINTDGVIRFTVTKGAEDNMIARILHLVEEAEAAKAPTARFIDRFSRIYTPGVMVVAALIAFAPPLLFGADLQSWLYKGLAILLIGCPCALVLSTPAAITSGISAGARRGLLVKGGAVLEALAGLRAIAFDKTGTLTRGRPEVTDMEAFSGNSTEMLALAAAVEAGSSHPLAKAICARAAALGVDVPKASAGTALPGRGVQAVVDGVEVLLAAPRHADSLGALGQEAKARVAALEGAGKTVVVVLAGGEALGLIALRDELRADAAAAIARLKAMGLGATMLTGDNHRTARALAASLGVAVEAELLPEDKLNALDKLPHPVAMVGDGINDAPALARADVGIAMGGGTDVALETADAALLHARVADVPALVALARATMGNIRQNIALALGLKAVFLVTTLFGVTALWMAILADTGATVLVTLNALRLLGFREHPAERGN